MNETVDSGVSGHMGGEIIAERFSLLKTRGSNGLAFTHIVEDTLDGRRLVVKVSDRLGILALEYLKAANLLAESGVRGILLPLEGGLLDEEEGYYLAFSEVEEPSLENYLRMRPSLTCEEALHVLKGVLRVLEDLHRVGFLHLFLEPRNIFYLPHRSLTLKDPALRAEFFHPFLELISAPDFSYLHPSLMDGGLPGPEADLYAFGKLAERLHSSTLDGCTSSSGRFISMLARTCEEVAGLGWKAAGMDVMGTMASLQCDLEKVLAEARSSASESSGRFKKAMSWLRGSHPGDEDCRAGRDYGAGTSRPTLTGEPRAVMWEWVKKGDSTPWPTGPEVHLGDVQDSGVSDDGGTATQKPGAAARGSRVGAGSDRIERAFGGFTAASEAKDEAHQGIKGRGRTSRTRRFSRAKALRVGAVAACLILLLSVFACLLVAKRGENPQTALGWGASKAGVEEVLYPLEEARKGLGGEKDRDDEVAEGRELTSCGEAAPVSPEKDNPSLEKTAGSPSSERVPTGMDPVSPRPPVARFSVSPAEGQSPLRVFLDASGSYDPDGRIISFRWSCGGESIAFYQVFESNLIPARIAVTLTVTDDGGNTGSVTHYVTLY